MLRTTSCLAALALALPAAAQSIEPRPPLWEFLTFERIAQYLIQSGVIAARQFVDITYEDIAGDLVSSTLTLRGLTVAPDLPWDAAGGCAGHAERVFVASTPVYDWDTIDVTVEVTGVTMSPDCLPPEATAIIGPMGLTEIAIDRLMIEATYRYGQSALLVGAHADLPGLGQVDLDVDFAYAWYRQLGFFQPPLPVLDLTSASLTFTDAGLLEALPAVVPGPLQGFFDPASAPTLVAQGVQQGLYALNGLDGEPSDLTPQQAAFAEAAGAAVGRTLTEGGPLTVSTAPEGGLRIDPTYVQRGSGEQLFADLDPQIGAATPGQTAMIPAGELRRALEALDTDAALDRDTRLRIGAALLSGVGAPQSLEAGGELLEPLLEARDPDALMAVAEPLAAYELDDAYEFALMAGAAGAEGAQALMARLERDLPADEMLEIQEEIFEDWLGEDESKMIDPIQGGLPAIRAAALAHLTGQGAPRFFGGALYWASMGAAAGDPASEAIIRQLDRQMAYRGEDAAEMWAELKLDVGGIALRTWIEEDVPAQIGR